MEAVALLIFCRCAGHSRIICHISAPFNIFPIINDVSFSPSLICLTTYPVSLLIYIAKVYLAQPSFSVSEKFWRVFILMPKWQHKFEQWAISSKGKGTGGDVDNTVVEIFWRDTAKAYFYSSGIQRVLEGWSKKGGPCQLSEIASLRDIWAHQSTYKRVCACIWTASTFLILLQVLYSDPTLDLPFTLGMTRAQLKSRSEVSLPYTHEGI